MRGACSQLRSDLGHRSLRYPSVVPVRQTDPVPAVCLVEDAATSPFTDREADGLCLGRSCTYFRRCRNQNRQVIPGQLAMLQQMPTGAHLDHPGIYRKLCKSCTITFPAGPGIFVVDGENVKHNGKVEMTCHKKKVPVLAERASLVHQL